MADLLATVYCTSADIDSILSEVGADDTVDDDVSGSVSVGESARIDDAIQYATARVNLYCQMHYEVEDLASSQNVRWWTAILAARQLARRARRPTPAALQEMFEETMEELKQVRSGDLHVPGIPQRTTPAPAWSNVRVPVGRVVRQIVVERPISDTTPSRAPQTVDRAAEVLQEPTGS